MSTHRTKPRSHSLNLVIAIEQLNPRQRSVLPLSHLLSSLTNAPIAQRTRKIPTAIASVKATGVLPAVSGGTRTNRNASSTATVQPPVLIRLLPAEN
ncbi:hypothetical protein H6G04_30210 [Calothrix membranacea FACHB-236]|nr:hypothetical protein [Calothrix membranacea FACHB-236]